VGKTRDIDPADIVDCAIGVLAEIGFAKFSGVKVAQRFGIRQSHLTYYFPTRDDLLAAMSERVTERYAQFVEDWCREAMLRPGEPIAHIIDQLIVDAVSPPTSILFPALWEAANEDANMAAALDNIYRSAQARMILMLGINPEGPEAEPLWRLINVLGVIIEGTTAIYGRREADDPEVIRLCETAKELLLPAFAEALKRRQEGSSVNP
jgi:AcrR family transcriptional regulator